MFLWVVVDIENQIDKIGIAHYGNSTEALFKQASCSSIPFVDGFGVGVEEVGKGL